MELRDAHVHNAACIMTASFEDDKYNIHGFLGDPVPLYTLQG